MAQRSVNDATLEVSKALIVAHILDGVPIAPLLNSQSSEVRDFVNGFLASRRRDDDPAPCPHPDLIGKIICKPFTVYETTKDFYGRVTWDEDDGAFFIKYEDGDGENMTANEIRRRNVTMNHFFDRIDETGNRSQKFSRFLKFLSKNKRRRVHKAYTALGKDTLVRSIGPHLWPNLGRVEREKVENAKKVLEYVYCN